MVISQQIHEDISVGKSLLDYPPSGFLSSALPSKRLWPSALSWYLSSCLLPLPLHNLHLCAPLYNDGWKYPILPSVSFATHLSCTGPGWLPNWTPHPSLYIYLMPMNWLYPVLVDTHLQFNRAIFLRRQLQFYFWKLFYFVLGDNWLTMLW